VATDGSGNISTVTDARTTATTLLSGMAGRATLPTLAGLTVFGSSSLDNAAFTTDGSGNISKVGNITSSGQLNFGATVSGSQSFLRYIAGLVQMSTPQAGSATGHVFQTWNGTVGFNAFSIGGQFGSAPAYVDNSGNYNGPVGGGVPTTRNAVALSARIFTGTTTPSSPRAGDIWLNQ
jgi:hypothetical protein